MRIAIIGAGNMGGAVARGLAATAEATGHQIVVSNPSQTKLDALHTEYPVINITNSNVQAIAGADLVILAVKPWRVQEVIEELKPHLDYSTQAVASMAGGVGAAQINGWLAQEGQPLPPLYLIIPNTAIAVRQSTTFIASVNATPQLDAQVQQLFSVLGLVVPVEERLIPAGTALASCGIAYAMRYIRAAAEGGVELGFYPAQAQQIVMQTLAGAVDLLRHTGGHPEQEIDRVTTPGGLTIKGLNAMERSGFTAAVIDGLKASMK